MDFNIGGEACGHVSNTSVYTLMKSFRRFNFDDPCQSTKLKSPKFMCNTSTVLYHLPESLLIQCKSCTTVLAGGTESVCLQTNRGANRRV